MRSIIKSWMVVLIAYLFCLVNIRAQEVNPNELGGQVNIISTAVPFLGITPDSRSGGMGNAGVAISPDVNAQHWNPAKFAFIQGDMGFAMSYTPWLRKLVNDINMYYLTGFKRIDEMQVISGSLRYFTLGEIIFKETPDDNPMTVKPNEFAIDLGYSRVLSDHLSGAVVFRYIRSDLNSGISQQGDMQPGNSFSADLAFYFRTSANLFGQNTNISSGLNISNIGNKISYDGGDTKQFIPTNMRLGVAASTDLDAYNSITFTVDANKLLVPTPGLAAETQDDYALEYKDMSVTKAIFRSFSDAPGGFKEELQEISYSVGLEYWYDKQFAARVGYFHEHENKGNRKHFTAGVGLKFNMLTIDASYIIPVVQNNPLANTIRFTLGIDMDGIIKQK